MYGAGGGVSYDALVDVCVASAMSAIRNLSIDQLNELLNDDSRLDTIIDNLPQVRSMPSEREAGLAQNKSLAEWNLSQEPKVTELREQVRDNYTQAKQLKSETEALKKQLDSHAVDKSLETTSMLLQVATQEADDEAESLARQLEDGSLGADVFLKEFLEKKALAHKRKIKSERLMNLLNDQQRNSTSNVRPGSMPMPPYPDLGASSNTNRHSLW